MLCAVGCRYTRCARHHQYVKEATKSGIRTWAQKIMTRAEGNTERRAGVDILEHGALGGKPDSSKRRMS